MSRYRCGSLSAFSHIEGIIFIARKDRAKAVWIADSSPTTYKGDVLPPNSGRRYLDTLLTGLGKHVTFIAREWRIHVATPLKTDGHTAHLIAGILGTAKPFLGLLTLCRKLQFDVVCKPESILQVTILRGEVL
jgi:hypothetical protein